MPHVALLEDVPGIGKKGDTCALPRQAAASLAEQGKAQYLDFAGQPIPAAIAPTPKPEGKTTNDVDNPSLQDSIPDTGTQPRKMRRRLP